MTGDQKPASAVDWRKILVVYIDHVGTCEGVDFLSERYHEGLLSQLTPEELAALLDAASEYSSRGAPTR